MATFVIPPGYGWRDRCTGSTALPPGRKDGGRIVVIIGTLEMKHVAELASWLRGRGVTALALESIGLAALLMATVGVSTIVVFETQLPRDWDAARGRLSQLWPHTRIVVVGSGDRRTAEELAYESVGAYEG